MVSGIYTITNAANNKIYVGKAVNVNQRLIDHRAMLIKNRHYNTHLQKSWNKYKWENFEFEILEECEEKFLFSQENYWCNILNTRDDRYGYNISLTHPEGSSRLTKETIEKRTATRLKNATAGGCIWKYFPKNS